MAFSAARIASVAERAAQTLPLLALTLVALWMFGNLRWAYDASEQQRVSLPPAVMKALRKLERPIRIEVWLDRDDGRRAQLERDTLAKLRLARPDLQLVTPLDGRDRPEEGVRDDAYGRILVRVGNATRQTRSTSRRELTTLLFEAAGQPLPGWSQAQYAGYPLVIERSARTLAAATAYALLPGILLVSGWFATQVRRRTR